MKKIFIIGSSAFSIIHFRSDLVKLLQKKNKVIILSLQANNKELHYIKNNLKVKYYPLKFSRDNFSFFSDFKTFFLIRKIINIEKPNIIFSFNVKPSIFVGISLFFFNIKKIKFIPTVTGIGTGLFGNGLFRKSIKFLLMILYFFAFLNSKIVIFQNNDDKNFFLKNKLINIKKTTIIPGSGVNTNSFKYSPLAPFPLKFLMISRLVNEKGVFEFYNAAKIIYKLYPDVMFQLIGSKEESIDRISDKNMNLITNNNFIDYIKFSSDIFNLISKCHIFVLPSYHEGMPRSVLESMSVGRPIITTNVNGCKDTVIDKLNGFCISPKNVKELVEKMTWFINNKHMIKTMGKESRKIAVDKFDVIKINNLYLNLI